MRAAIRHSESPTPHRPRLSGSPRSLPDPLPSRSKSEPIARELSRQPTRSAETVGKLLRIQTPNAFDFRKLPPAHQAPNSGYPPGPRARDEKKPPFRGAEPGKKETCETAKPKTLDLNPPFPNSPQAKLECFSLVVPPKGPDGRSKARIRGLLPSLRVIPSGGLQSKSCTRNFQSRRRKS